MHSIYNDLQHSNPQITSLSTDVFCSQIKNINPLPANVENMVSSE